MERSGFPWLLFREWSGADFPKQLKRNGQINLVGILPYELFCDLLDCAIRSDDITKEQEQRMLDLRAEKCS
jgi:hypothetical protein